MMKWWILMVLGIVATSFDSFVPADDLVAYYDFNGCARTDGTGLNPPAQAYGDVNCWCGVDDEGLLLDGKNDYISFPGSVNRHFSTSDFTISFYFRADGYSIFPFSLVSKREDCGEEHLLDIQLDFQGSLIQTEVQENEYKRYREISPEYPGPGWVHFALVRKGRYAYTFINGLLMEKASMCSGVDLTNEAVLTFGKSPCVQAGKARPFRGAVDEVRVYKRALSEQEIQQLYEMYPVENAETDCLS